MLHGQVDVPYVLLVPLYATIVVIVAFLGFCKSGSWLHRVLHYKPRGSRGSAHGTSPSRLTFLEIHRAVCSRIQQSSLCWRRLQRLPYGAGYSCPCIVFISTLTRGSFLGASGRSRRFLQARLCAHIEPCGRQVEPIFEVLHRRQHAPHMERHHGHVWRRPHPSWKTRRWRAAKCSYIDYPTPVRVL